VRKGQPLFTTYSPELQSAGEELRIAQRLARDSEDVDAIANESARRLAEATRGRLRNPQVADQMSPRQTFHSPANESCREDAIQGRASHRERHCFASPTSRSLDHRRLLRAGQARL